MHVYFLQLPTGGGDFNINATTAEPYTQNQQSFKGKLALLDAVFQPPLEFGLLRRDRCIL